MHGTQMRYLLVAGVALVLGLLVAGTSVQSVLLYALLLACPLMMVFMMRSMGGHAGHGNDQPVDERHHGPASDRDSATGR